MQATKMLDMINEGRIEELKSLLEDEIYEASLKSKPDAKRRYAAMKKYFGYIKSEREILQKPCKVEFEGENYISFCNSYSLALTTEDCGEIELYDDPSRYPQVGQLIHFNGIERKVDFGKVFAEAKSKGYKLKKSELDSVKYKYLMKFDGAYFKLGLLDAAFAIIDEGKPATVYHDPDKKAPMTVKTDIGICMVLPMRFGKDYDPIADGHIVIGVE